MALVPLKGKKRRRLFFSLSSEEHRLFFCESIRIPMGHSTQVHQLTTFGHSVRRTVVKLFFYQERNLDAIGLAVPRKIVAHHTYQQPLLLGRYPLESQRHRWKYVSDPPKRVSGFVSATILPFRISRRGDSSRRVISCSPGSKVRWKFVALRRSFRWPFRRPFR